MTQKASTALRDAWTAYWRTGQTASCFCGAQAESQFEAIWRGFLDRFSDGARLIDLAAGHGAAARVCAARARERGLNVHVEAVDVADISAAALDPSTQGIAFRSHVSLEALPYEDGSFDGAFSQFGFEYAHEERAASEVARVLAAGGRLSFILHARGGAVFRDIQKRLERLEQVLADDGPATLVLALARAAEAKDMKTLLEKSSQLSAASALLERLAIGAPADDAALFYSRAFLSDWARRERYRPADLRQAIEAGWDNASGVAMRQRQMVRAARSREQIDALCARLTRLGLLVESPRAITRPDVQGDLAWLVEGTKNGAAAG